MITHVFTSFLFHFYEKMDDGIFVKVNHVMEKEHFIEWIALVFENKEYFVHFVLEKPFHPKHHQFRLLLLYALPHNFQSVKSQGDSIYSGKSILPVGRVIQEDLTSSETFISQIERLLLLYALPHNFRIFVVIFFLLF